MRKALRIFIVFVMAIVVILASIALWLRYHPIQDFTCAITTGVQYPCVMYIPYPVVGMADKFREQAEEFNETNYKVVQQKMDKYPKELNLTYDLDRHDKGGVTVTLYGSGTTKDGEKEEFKEVLEFPITIERTY